MPTDATAAVDDALAAYTARGPRAAIIGAPAGDGWFTVAELARRPEPHVARLAARFGGLPLVGGAFLVAWVSVAIVEPALRVWVATGALPRLDPRGVRVHPGGEGWVDQVAFATVDDGQSAEAFGTGLVSALGPLVEAVHALAPIGRRGLWGLVADALGGATVLLSNEQGDDSARVATDRVLDAMSPPCIARPRWRYATGSGALTIRRGSCCMAFHVDDHGYCPTCPMAGREAAREARRASGRRGPSPRT